MSDEEYDPQIYSDHYRYVDDEKVRLTWKELYEITKTELDRAEKFARIAHDLSRNVRGRHEGDSDVFDPTGISQGNPNFSTGDVVGYQVGGRPYFMPPWNQRHDPYSWKVKP